MLDTLNTWSDYRITIRAFDAVLEHGKAVANTWAAHPADGARATYGERIFGKLLTHCVALRRMAPDPLRALPADLSDLPSMSALARCIIEAFDAFEYVAGHDVSTSERSFRIRLWELHDATRRLKTLAMLGVDDPGIANLHADAHRLRTALETHEHLATLSADLQAELRRRLDRGDPPAFHLNQRQRSMLSGLDPHWHEVATTQLNQHVLTLPFSTRQLMTFQPATPEGLRLLAQPLVLALPLLTRVIQKAVELMPAHAPEPPSRTARTMAMWRRWGALQAA